MSETTCKKEHHPLSTLYLAFELGSKQWKLGFTIGLGQRPRERTIAGGDLVAFQEEIRLAKKRFKLAQTARVMSCYEAGRDGFWLHRYLLSKDIENLVVGSASIEVNRRATMLIRYEYGEKRVWSVVHVPSPEAEDKRHLHRQLATRKVDRTRHINRIKGLLAGQEVRMPVGTDFLERLAKVRLWDGSALPKGLRSRLQREYACFQFVNQQIKELEAERTEAIRTSDDPSVEKVRQLIRLRGIGDNSAWLFVMEFFGWRKLRNRRQVGGLSGLTPTPHQSGDESQE